MCFNKETSLGVYLVGTACVIYILYRGYTTNNVKDIIAGWFLLPIVQMQIIEFFLWRNLKCNFTNKFFSLMIILLLWIQPFSYFWVKYIYQKQQDIPKKEKIKKFSVLSVGTFIFALAFYYCYKNFDKLCSLPDKQTCRLVWKSGVLLFENHAIFTIILLIAYFAIYFIADRKDDKNKTKLELENENKEKKYFFTNNIITIVLIISIIATIYLKGKYFYTILGSVFCFMCAFYGIFRILRI